MGMWSNPYQILCYDLFLPALRKNFFFIKTDNIFDDDDNFKNEMIKMKTDFLNDNKNLIEDLFLNGESHKESSVWPLAYSMTQPSTAKCPLFTLEYDHEIY